MNEMDDILENAAIEAWIGVFSRSEAQANAPHETDAELIELPGVPDQYLAITIDTVVEEIRSGLYRDPYTMGWVAAMATLSDLAAVGAEPLGIVVSVSVPNASDAALTEGAARGVEAACRSVGVHVLGGDTNESPSVSLTGCAVGLVPSDRVLTRRGLEPGDAVFLTGRAGDGNALGLVRLAGLPDSLFPEERYRPSARLSAGLALRGVATACMDTSDGVLATLDQLARLNGLGFEVACDWPSILSGGALELCEETGTPPWMMLAGPHGEFELAFALPGSAVDAFVEDASAWSEAPVRVGTVLNEAGVALSLPSGRRAEIDMAPVRNLLQTSVDDPDAYRSELRKLGRLWNLE